MQRFMSEWEPAPRRTAAEETLFAIGDVHGCTAQLDLLLAVLKGAIADAAAAGRRSQLVMLGDYIDRGPDSIGALRRVAGLERELGLPVTALRGNHDQFMIDALRPDASPGGLGLWIWNGGGTTLDELDIAGDEAQGDPPTLTARRLRDALGHDLAGFVDRLAVHRRIGEYLFVHAGVHPQRPVEMHEPEELIWIREPFLSGQGWRHPYAVVHGHTPTGPEMRPHRIGVDSGCFRTGVLTAVELKDGLVRFHAVTDSRGLAERPSVAPPTFLTVP